MREKTKTIMFNQLTQLTRLDGLDGALASAGHEGTFLHITLHSIHLP